MGFFDRFSKDARRLHPADRAVLKEMGKHWDLSEIREQNHLILFRTESDAKFALGLCEKNGWLPDGQQPVFLDEINDDRQWALYVKRADLPVNDDTIPDARDFFEKIAADLNGEYDGWEATVTG